MRTGFIFTVILSFALLPASTYVSQVSADDDLFDNTDDPAEAAGELFDAGDDTALFADDSPVNEDPPVDKKYPDTERPGFGEIKTQIEQSTGIFKVQELKTKIREEDDETQRQELAGELTKEMQKLFDEDFQKRDDEVKKLEDRVAKLRASLDKRKAARDRIIKNRIESVMLEADGLGLPGESPESPWASIAGGFADSFSDSNIPTKPHSVTTVETYPDGSRKVKIQYTETRMEQRHRETPYTVMVPQTRTRMVNGQQQEYMVNVPEQRNRSETYTVAVPVQRERELIVEKGQSVQAAVGNFLRGQSADEPRFGPNTAWRIRPAFRFGNDVRTPPPSPIPVQDQRPRLITDEPTNRRDEH